MPDVKMSDTRAMLDVKGLSRRLGEFLISEVSFTVGEGEYFVLLGASGTGKTVLLEILTGVITPDSGSVLLAGRRPGWEGLISGRLSRG
jgi:ABC-type multidrug transport system ATPase subunit